MREFHRRLRGSAGCYFFGRAPKFVVQMERQGDSYGGKWGRRSGRRTTSRCTARGTHAYTFPAPESPLPPWTPTSKWHTRPQSQPASSQPWTPAWELPPMDHQLHLSRGYSSADDEVVVVAAGSGERCDLVVGDGHRVGSSGWRHWEPERTWVRRGERWRSQPRLLQNLPSWSRVATCMDVTHILMLLLGRRVVGRGVFHVELLLLGLVLLAFGSAVLPFESDG